MAVIEELLAGDLSVGSFLAEFWDQRPLHLRDNPTRLARWFSHARLERFLREPLPATSFLLAYFDRYWNTSRVDDARAYPSFRIPPSEASAAYEAGATVGVFKLEEGVPELRELCRGLRTEIGLCNEPSAAALWSPHGRGFGPHFDCIGTTILQIEGAKEWRYSSEPALPFPIANAILRAGTPYYFESDPAPDDWQIEIDPGSLVGWTEVTLQPGDILFLPPGHWHMAAASERSLAITIQTKPMRMPSFLAGLLRTEHQGTDWDAVPAMLDEGGVNGGARREGLRYLTERLDEAINTLMRWRHDKREMLGLWIVHEGAIDALYEQPREETLTGDTVVEISPRCRFISSPADRDFLIGIGPRLVRLQDPADTVLRWLLDLRQGKVSQISVPGLSHVVVDEVLRALVRMGVARVLH